MDVVVPANSSATLYLPTAAADRITESGRPLGEARSVTMLGTEGSSAVLKLESGRYSFVSKVR